MNYQKIYNFYTKYNLENGEPPTLQEIGNNFGFTREYARQVMERMEEEGYIFRLKRSRVPYGFVIEKFTNKNQCKK